MDKKLRAILVGCGGISGAWLTPIRQFDDVEIVGLVDLKPENAAATKARFELDRAEIGDDLTAMLKRLAPDLVFDCTLPEAHTKVATAALSCGAHVLGEKPMAVSMPEARQAVAAAEKAGKIYAVIQNRRYMDNIVAFRKAVTDGCAGRLHTLNADFFIGAHFGGFREVMRHVLILDMAIHTFDQARHISGQDPLAVYCHEWNPPGSWYEHGASAIAIFEMSEGVIFRYQGSWCAEGMNTSWECQWRAIGDQGSMLWDGRETIVGERPIARQNLVSPVESFQRPIYTHLNHQGHAGVIREFLDCVRNGGRPQTDCRDNIKSLAMVHGAIKSAEQRRKVDLSSLADDLVCGS